MTEAESQTTQNISTAWFNGATLKYRRLSDVMGQSGGPMKSRELDSDAVLRYVGTSPVPTQRGDVIQKNDRMSIIATTPDEVILSSHKDDGKQITVLKTTMTTLVERDEFIIEQEDKDDR